MEAHAVGSIGRGLLKVVKAIQIAAKKAAENRQDIDRLSANLTELTPILEQLDNPKKAAFQGVPETTTEPLILGLHSALQGALKAINDCESTQERWLGLKPVVYAEAHAAALRRATKLVNRYLGQIFEVLSLQQNANLHRVLASLEALRFNVSEGTRKLQNELQGIRLDGSKQLAILQRVARKLEIPEQDVLGHFTTLCNDLGIKELRAADISKESLLYSGHQTAVYKAVLTCGLQFGDSFRETRTTVAVKEFRNAAYLFEKFKAEVEMLQGAATCANVCRLIGVYESETDLGLVMKFYEGGDLGRAIHRVDGGLGWDLACKYGLDVSKALVELHQSNIVVRDLKPQNVLLDKNGSAIVADFGISKPVYTTLRTYAGTRAEASGTLYYMAPEAFVGDYGKGTDSWSFACIVLEMVTGKAPFLGDKFETVWAKVVHHRKTPNIPSSTPPQLLEVLRKCFSYEQSQRPSFQEIYLCFFQEHETRKNLAFLKAEAEARLEAALSEEPVDASALHAAMVEAEARGVDKAALERAENALDRAAVQTDELLHRSLREEDRALLEKSLKAAADLGRCDEDLVSRANNLLRRLLMEEQWRQDLERDLAGTDLSSLRRSLAAYERCKPNSPLAKQGHEYEEVLEEFAIACENVRTAIAGESKAQLRVALRALRDLQSNELLQKEALLKVFSDLHLLAEEKRADLEVDVVLTTAPQLVTPPEKDMVLTEPAARAMFIAARPADSVTDLFGEQRTHAPIRSVPCSVGLNVSYWVLCWPVHLAVYLGFVGSCCCCFGSRCQSLHPPGCGSNERLCLCDWAHWFENC